MPRATKESSRSPRRPKPQCRAIGQSLPQVHPPGRNTVFSWTRTRFPFHVRSAKSWRSGKHRSSPLPAKRTSTSAALPKDQSNRRKNLPGYAILREVRGPRRSRMKFMRNFSAFLTKTLSTNPATTKRSVIGKATCQNCSVNRSVSSDCIFRDYTKSVAVLQRL